MMAPVISTHAVFRKSDGELQYLAPAALVPAAGDVTLDSATLPAGYNDATHRWNAATRVMVEDATKVEEQLLASVKVEAERRKMLLLSSGGAKKTEYADKAREVAAWDSLGGTLATIVIAFNALSASVKQSRFPYAIASAGAFGDTPADAIARFRAGIARSASVPAIAAIEEKVCAAIKSASTATAKRAAAIATAWPS